MDAKDDANARSDRAEPQPAARHRLLIVEDEAVIRFVLRCEFEQRGFAVTEVEDGASALELFKRDPRAWTGAFVDLLLPDTHGDALIERLLDLRPDLPVVLMTGDCDPDTERKARERALTVLRKPFPLERVRPLVAAMLRHAEATAQEQSA
ncbi:MAG: response regulator [Enhygromyxa sp.]